MLLLDAVNTVLPALGEHVVTAIDDKHPTVSLIVRNIALKRKELLARGWWFNTKTVKLYPDSDGFIPLPTETLSVESLNGVQVGSFLVQATTLSKVWVKPEEVQIVVDTPFEDLPHYVASTVLYTALVQAYVTDIGLERVVESWRGEAALASSNMMAEHLRNKRYSTRKSARFWRIQNAVEGR